MRPPERRRWVSSRDCVSGRVAAEKGSNAHVTVLSRSRLPRLPGEGAPSLQDPRRRAGESASQRPRRGVAKDTHARVGAPCREAECLLTLGPQSGGESHTGDVREGTLPLLSVRPDRLLIRTSAVGQRGLSQTPAVSRYHIVAAQQTDPSGRKYARGTSHLDSPDSMSAGRYERGSFHQVLYSKCASFLLQQRCLYGQEYVTYVQSMSHLK